MILTLSLDFIAFFLHATIYLVKTINTVIAIIIIVIVLVSSNNNNLLTGNPFARLSWEIEPFLSPLNGKNTPFFNSFIHHHV